MGKCDMEGEGMGNVNRLTEEKQAALVADLEVRHMLRKWLNANQLELIGERFGICRTNVVEATRRQPRALGMSKWLELLTVLEQRERYQLRWKGYQVDKIAARHSVDRDTVVKYWRAVVEGRPLPGAKRCE